MGTASGYYILVKRCTRVDVLTVGIYGVQHRKEEKKEWFEFTSLSTTTVSTFTSGTKCLGSLDIIHDRTLGWHLVSFSWMHKWTVPIERSFELQARWVINVFGLFHWHVIYGCLYTQAPADFWSTGAGIKCLYCNCMPYCNEMEARNRDKIPLPLKIIPRGPFSLLQKHQRQPSH